MGSKNYEKNTIRLYIPTEVLNYYKKIVGTARTLLAVKLLEAVASDGIENVLCTGEDGKSQFFIYADGDNYTRLAKAGNRNLRKVLWWGMENDILSVPEFVEQIEDNTQLQADKIECLIYQIERLCRQFPEDKTLHTAAKRMNGRLKVMVRDIRG